MKKSILFLLLLSAVIVLQSCDKDDALDAPESLTVPELPPMELYSLPTEKIAHNDSLMEEHSRCARDNWIHAGLSVLVWNSVVVVNLAIPTGAIALAFNEDAQYIGNNTFEWSYQYTTNPALGGNTYDISLTAQYVTSTEIEWILTASELGGFSNFQWIKAIIPTDFSEAEFVFYQNPTAPETYLQINSERDVMRQVYTTRLTNVIPGHADNGHYIQYGVMNNNAFNRSFNLFAGPDNVLDIEWNEPTRDGRVRHAYHFGNDAWYCWDENQCNSICN